MIPERHMVSAVPVDGGERVTGYYLETPSKLSVLAIYTDNSLSGVDFIPIDPDTIEPVRVEMIQELDNDGDYIGQYCPNCGAFDEYGSFSGYCEECGMALEWENDKDE